MTDSQKGQYVFYGRTSGPLGDSLVCRGARKVHKKVQPPIPIPITFYVDAVLHSMLMHGNHDNHHSNHQGNHDNHHSNRGHVVGWWRWPESQLRSQLISVSLSHHAAHLPSCRTSDFFGRRNVTFCSTITDRLLMMRETSKCYCYCYNVIITLLLEDQ